MIMIVTDTSARRNFVKSPAIFRSSIHLVLLIWIEMVKYPGRS
ncbi:hypothetical protein NECAME_17163 [Necator americanus]|uniref:Uncharacterized protein n=1 Tax=Necator americanus TaxID=51031 RepID=W2TT91_NECAM|nr:hypothetical protein NECAME_17163 [Necator americanus]ETN84321.1 hypothetical protein NECAME_17163 [Necator americanus]